MGTEHLKPTLISLGNSTIKARFVQGGEEHTIVITTSGALLSFGSNRDGQLGVGRPKMISKGNEIERPKYESDLIIQARSVIGDINNNRCSEIKNQSTTIGNATQTTISTVDYNNNSKGENKTNAQ